MGFAVISYLNPINLLFLNTISNVLLINIKQYTELVPTFLSSPHLHSTKDPLLLKAKLWSQLMANDTYAHQVDRIVPSVDDESFLQDLSTNFVYKSTNSSRLATSTTVYSSPLWQLQPFQTNKSMVNDCGTNTTRSCPTFEQHVSSVPSVSSGYSAEIALTVLLTTMICHISF